MYLMKFYNTMLSEDITQEYFDREEALSDYEVLKKNTWIEDLQLDYFDEETQTTTNIK